MLAEVVRQVPSLLDFVQAESLAPLLSTCKQLRCYVQSFVSSICCATHADFHILVSIDWPRLRSLDLRNVSLDAELMAQLNAAAYTLLTSLCLNGCGGLQVAGISEFVKGHYLLLESLDLSSVKLNAMSASPLREGDWPLLRHLDLHANHMGAEAMGALIKCNLPLLESLSIGDNWFHGPATGAELAKGKWPLLQKLVLMWTDIEAEELKMVLDGDWPELEDLDLSHDVYLKSDAIEALSEATWRIKRLMLVDIRLDKEGIFALVKGAWTSLEVLDLSANNLDADAMIWFMYAELPVLKSFELSANRIDRAAVRNLAQCACPKHKYLGLRENNLSTAAIKDLFLGRWPFLERLDVSDNNLDHDARMVLSGHNQPLMESLNYIQHPAHVGFGRWLHLKFVDISRHDTKVERISGLVEGVDVEVIDDD